MRVSEKYDSNLLLIQRSLDACRRNISLLVVVLAALIGLNLLALYSASARRDLSLYAVMLHQELVLVVNVFYLKYPRYKNTAYLYAANASFVLWELWNAFRQLNAGARRDQKNVPSRLLPPPEGLVDQCVRVAFVLAKLAVPAMLVRLNSALRSLKAKKQSAEELMLNVVQEDMSEYFSDHAI